MLSTSTVHFLGCILNAVVKIWINSPWKYRPGKVLNILRVFSSLFFSSLSLTVPLLVFQFLFVFRQRLGASIFFYSFAFQYCFNFFGTLLVSSSQDYFSYIAFFFSLSSMRNAVCHFVCVKRNSHSEFVYNLMENEIEIELLLLFSFRSWYLKLSKSVLSSSDTLQIFFYTFSVSWSVVFIRISVVEFILRERKKKYDSQAIMK